MAFSMSRQLAAEFVGTVMLVGVVIGSGIMGDALSSDDAVSLWGNTAATGAILVVLILIFGPVSGAHFNPAVTLAFRLRKEIATGAALAFVVAQIAGGCAGAIIANVMFDLPAVQLSDKVRTGPTQLLSEAVATFSLLAAIFGCVRFKPEAVPYAVGLVITAGYWWTSSTSFANPAVAIARTLSDTFAGIRPVDAPAFVIVQLLTAAIATPLLMWLFKAED
ncbi:MAG: MIP/aquaporin family protein [Pseudomonadota bacterium]